MVFAAVVAMSAVTVTARRVKKPIEQIAQAFRDFAGEEDIDLIIREDNRPPTNYVGDVMKAQTTSIKQSTGSKKFNYKYVQSTFQFSGFIYKFRVKMIFLFLLHRIIALKHKMESM